MLVLTEGLLAGVMQTFYTLTICFSPSVLFLCLFFCNFTIRCGDEIMEINDTVVYNMALNDVYTVLSQCMPGPVNVIISRHSDPKVCNTSFTLTSRFIGLQGKAFPGSCCVNVTSWVQLWVPMLLANSNRLDWSL